MNWYGRIKTSHIGLQRMLSHMENGSFGIVSAQNNALPNGLAAENIKDAKMRQMIQEHNVGFFPVQGAFMNCKINKVMPEKSVFVIDPPEKLIQQIAKNFKQDAYIWGSGGFFWLKNSDGQSLMQGKVAEWFHEMPDNTPIGYTKIKDKKWTFSPPEQPIPVLQE